MTITNEIEWNINQGYGITLLKLIDKVNEASTISDEEWFNALRVLFRNIEHIKKVDKEAMKTIDTKMVSISSSLDTPTSKSLQSIAYNKTLLKNAKKDLDQVNRDLMKEINKADLIKFHAEYKDPGKAVMRV